MDERDIGQRQASPEIQAHASEVLRDIIAERLKDPFDATIPVPPLPLSLLREAPLQRERLHQMWKASKQFERVYTNLADKIQKAAAAGRPLTEKQYWDEEDKVKGICFEWLCFYASVIRFTSPNTVVLSPDDAKILHKALFPDETPRQAGTEQEAFIGQAISDFYVARRDEAGEWKIKAGIECTTTFPAQDRTQVRLPEKYLSKKPDTLNAWRTIFPHVIEDEVGYVLFLLENAKEPWRIVAQAYHPSVFTMLETMPFNANQMNEVRDFLLGYRHNRDTRRRSLRDIFDETQVS